MSTEPLQLPKKEKWGSKIGVVLAVSGSAVGLGNFLRFPGTAVNNGGGAFMIPYIISFILLGVPIAWCEWTIGRLGGRYGQNSGPGILYALSRNPLGKAVGTLTLVIPVAVYMYYVTLEALCVRYSFEFFSGGFAELFSQAGEGGAVDAVSDFTKDTFGMNANGAMYGGSMLWLVLGCFLVNFFIIYRGVTKGIEKFCLLAMPLLIGCALIVLVRVLTLSQVVDGRTIGHGLGFMWNPQWEALWNPEVWLRAAGQIFFSLSVGFGLILCYSSYLRKDDDVVLTALSASATNEFCEVILGGMIVVPAAILFLGPGSTPDSTFALGFFTVPAIMNYMPGGSFFGGMWFGLLFLAAVTSSISMLQPAIAFLEDGFGLRRNASVTVLAVITFTGAGLIMYFSENVQALDFTDFWCEFMMILAALGQVLIFGWVIGAEKGVADANRGADFRLPRVMPYVIRYVTPAFLLIVLGMWSAYNGPDRLRGMSPSIKGAEGARGAYATAIGEHFSADLDDVARGVYAQAIRTHFGHPPGGEALDAQVTEVLGVPDGLPESLDNLPTWLRAADAPAQQARDDALATKVSEILGVEEGLPKSLDGLPDWLRQADEAAEAARSLEVRQANVARFVFVGVLLFYIGVFAVSDIACRGRIKQMLAGVSPDVGSPEEQA